MTWHPHHEMDARRPRLVGSVYAASWCVRLVVADYLILSSGISTMVTQRQATTCARASFLTNLTRPLLPFLHLPLLISWATVSETRNRIWSVGASSGLENDGVESEIGRGHVNRDGANHESGFVDRSDLFLTAHEIGSDCATEIVDATTCGANHRDVAGHDVSCCGRPPLASDLASETQRSSLCCVPQSCD